ncbi:GNAT family N-acetyltransferase [Bacillus licheniformis]|nr:GNAT family N-acetyltransferase [Bacillus licheniformis]
MSYIEITKDNIEDNHICCALGAKQYENAINQKKRWLKARMDKGLVFYRLNERAKVFIEYLPADEVWVLDEAGPYFQLMALTWNSLAASPAFKQQVKSDFVNEKGITIYYTAQCPFAVGMLEDLRELTEKKGIQFQSIQLSSKEEAQKSPAIWTTFSVFFEGEFVTHEIMSINKFEKLLHKLLFA